MHEGVILLAVGHLPGIEPVGAATNAANRKDAGGGQRLVDFGEQPWQIGLLADVVGTFGDKMRHGAPLRLRRQREHGVNLAGTGTGE